MLAPLDIFQFVEYDICRGGPMLFWTIIVCLSITFLPVLSVHAISLITQRSFWAPLG